MAKRFTDTEIWKKEWFLELSPSMKCFWRYITDNCNHAGIWELNLKLASFSIGSKVTIEDIEKNFSDKIIFIDESKIFIPKFIMFQYKVNDFGELNELNRVHKSALDLINKYDLLDPSKTLTSPLIGVKDKDKDKDKEVDKDKNKDNLIIELYHEILCPPLPTIRVLSDKLKGSIKTFLNSDVYKQVYKQEEFTDQDQFFEWYFLGIKECPFLMGINDTNWQADFHWIIKTSNAEKIIGGRYTDKKHQKKVSRLEQTDAIVSAELERIKNANN